MLLESEADRAKIQNIRKHIDPRRNETHSTSGLILTAKIN